MKLFLKYFSMQLKTKLEYKVSFILMLISQMFTVLLEAVTIFFLFERFGLLKEFDFYTVMLIFSVIYFGYSLSDLFIRGFDQFHKFIIKGEFDILLIRPRNIHLQILGTDFAIERTSRLILPIITITIAITNGSIDYNLIKTLVLLLMILGSFLLFASVSIISAAFTFKSIEGLEIINIFQHGTRQFGQYPIEIFPKFIFYLFTFLVPLTTINYFPLIYIMGTSNNILNALAPLYTIIFLLFALFLFYKGTKNYQSTGS